MIDLTEFESRAVPLRALGVVVSQNGTQLARRLWDDTCRRNVYSASKSFTSMAVGIAQKEGLLSIDEKLTDAFKDDLPEIVSDNLKAATVRDLLTMCLGQEKSFLMGGERPYYEDRNWVRLALRQPFVYAPGEKFVYNNVGPYLAGILVQRRAGCDLVHYLMPRMFAPMGIQLPTWENDPNGQTFRCRRPVPHHRRTAPVRSVIVAKRRMERQAAHPRRVGQRSDLKTGRKRQRGLRLPLLGRPRGFLPRRRQIRPVRHFDARQKRRCHRHRRKPRCRCTAARRL